jgi:hypothetical protein
MNSLAGLRSTHRGHEIVLTDEHGWIYSDTGKPTLDDPARPCGYCDRPNTPEGHDACLADLPGVINACCGHGEPRKSYIQFADGRCVRGFTIDGEEG